jgi:diguanylate cyclase (GGDEF)-like protein/PAS domain S-box-containing protein
MGINFKLALPSLTGLVLIIVIIQIYWKPLQLENAKKAYEQYTHELLVLVESGITQHLLERDLGSLFSSIEDLKKSFESRWQNVMLYNDDGKQLYPLFKRNSELIKKESAYIHIIYPLSIGGTPLGRLELDADWGHERLNVIENINGVRDMVIWLVILSLLITVLSQYRIIYRPLKKLGRATNNIAQGKFSIDLPVSANDEIGELTHSFSMMMNELRFQKKALDQHAIVSAVDRNGVITYVNKKFVEISGYSREELIGKTHRVIKSNIHSTEFYKDMWETITRGSAWHGEVCNLKKTGGKYWVSSTIIPFLDEQGVPQRYISIRTDITQQKHSEEQLRHMANHDVLTGLPTRRLCKENLSMAIAVARRNNTKTAVLFIDLDGFKSVNDTFGHDAGDVLLTEVAKRLSCCVREVDTVARIGGDEFMIVLTGINNRENVALVAQKIIDTLDQSFTLNSNTATIGASIGIALYPDHEQEPEALIKRADEMMYAVKSSGKNNYWFCEDV